MLFDTILVPVIGLTVKNVRRAPTQTRIQARLTRYSIGVDGLLQACAYAVLRRITSTPACYPSSLYTEHGRQLTFSFFWYLNNLLLLRLESGVRSRYWCRKLQKVSQSLPRHPWHTWLSFTPAAREFTWSDCGTKWRATEFRNLQGISNWS